MSVLARIDSDNSAEMPMTLANIALKRNMQCIIVQIVITHLEYFKGKRKYYGIIIYYDI
jgi:hypothetical protein